MLTCFYCPLADGWAKRPHSLLMPLPSSCSCFGLMSKVCQASLPLPTMWYCSDSKASPFVWSTVTVAWWPAAVCSCVGFCWQKTPADTSLAAVACCAFRCCAALLAGCVTGCAGQAGCPACLQQGSSHARRHLSASLEYAETNTSFYFHQQLEDCSGRLREKKCRGGAGWFEKEESKPCSRGGMDGWLLIFCPSCQPVAWGGTASEMKADVMALSCLDILSSFSALLLPVLQNM